MRNWAAFRGTPETPIPSLQQFDSPDIPNVDKRVVNSIDPNNFAPRIGFAYSPLNSGKMVVRGGYGVFYSRTSFQYITLNVIAPPTYVFGARVGVPTALIWSIVLGSYNRNQWARIRACVQ